MFRGKCWSVQNKKEKHKTNPEGDWEAASGQVRERPADLA